MSMPENPMTVTSRPLLIVLLELGYFLFVLHLAGSPLGADLPVRGAAIGLVAGLIAIPIFLSRSRWPSSRPFVVAGVAVLLMASGCAALLMSSANRAADGGIVVLGVVLIASASTSRRSPTT
jgi:hypothetical protein